MAMVEFVYHDVDLILSGHLHLGGVVESAARYDIPGPSLLLIQAGSAASTRRREGANSFNLIRIERPHVSVERLNWSRERDSFALAAIDEFQLTPDGWGRISDDRTAPHR
jgi:3',5'-cyclic AMP phosphodiesterase CpdA